MAELKAQRERVRKRIDYANRLQRQEQGGNQRQEQGGNQQQEQGGNQQQEQGGNQQQEQGGSAGTWHAQARRQFEAERETARKALEAAERELAELERRPPTSEDEKVLFAARKAELKRQLKAAGLTHARAEQILTWLRELDELNKATPATDTERQALQEKMEKLRADIKLERARASYVRSRRKMRADPERRQQDVKYRRELAHRHDARDRLRQEGERWLRDEAPAPGSVDETELREFERQLAEDMHREPTAADWRDAVLDEAYDVDESLNDHEDLLRQNPSLERTAELQSSFERLQRELREERVAVEGAVFALANEYAYLEQTRAGSSSGPTWQERLRELHQEQLELRANWRARLRTRLDSLRRELDVRQRLPRFSDEAAEAELAQQIALLERELRNAGA
jgi:hypothetical protein